MNFQEITAEYTRQFNVACAEWNKHRSSILGTGARPDYVGCRVDYSQLCQLVRDHIASLGFTPVQVDRIYSVGYRCMPNFEEFVQEVDNMCDFLLYFLAEDPAASQDVKQEQGATDAQE